ncbi:hypothetical protein [Comamonas sp. NoAH]|uniref:hypothetical protein n=1 Tax=Comamonas halotolerans TaxID=3041496 RepID=UPI0024E0DA8C|nr:hypothetical protein [Comamonas sp. NoAH]
MPAMIRNLLNRRLFNAHDDGTDLPGDGATVIDADLQNDDDFESLKDLDRGDGQAPASAPETAPPPEVALEAPKAVAAVAEQDEGEDGKPHSGSVPMPRFNEVNERRKQAEQALAITQAELQQLRQASAKGITDEELDALEEKHTTAMLDGQVKEAVALRRQINQHIEQRAVMRIQQERLMEKSANAWNDAVDGLLTANPWLNTNDGAPILEILADVVEAKVAKGMSQFDALKEASKMLPRLAPASPQVAPGADLRTANSIKRGAQAAAAQAPVLQAGFGNRALSAAMYDIDSISDEAFMKLSEEEKAQMRGG